MTSNQKQKETQRHRPRSSSLSLSIARSPSVLSSGSIFPSAPVPTIASNPNPTPSFHNSTNTIKGKYRSSDDIDLNLDLNLRPDLESEIKHHPNIYGVHPYSNPIRRAISAGGVGGAASGVGGLDPILGDDDDDDEEEDDEGAEERMSSPQAKEWISPSISTSTSTSTNSRIYKSPQSTQHTRLRSETTSQLQPNAQYGHEYDHEYEYDNEPHDNAQRPLLPSRKVSFQPMSSHIPTSRSSPTHLDMDLELETNDTSISYDGPFQPPDSKELLSIILSVVGVMVLAIAAGCTTIFDWVL
ncbi:uncharacterized protein I303_107315 [Kwoniella dejecticola CBS 10117]|uniref:Uncharacterized protein n=1 Tax=Kwoniella dejecticola CBS 10117 TaxID=1296121 RepID=A0A1A5ZZE7_9TREE|nr:uncharacterized protein I303_06719 [Kwoniella dejecticola CBS 10117]OBR83160.1 hypothetical protein I303_06719 [Kwoniella dejecticola CBS 10117]